MVPNAQAVSLCHLVVFWITDPLRKGFGFSCPTFYLVDVMDAATPTANKVKVMTELAGEFTQGLFMCILLQNVVSPLSLAMWLSVYVVVATSSSLCNFSDVDVSSIRPRERYWYSFVLSSAPRRTSSEFIASSPVS